MPLEATKVLGQGRYCTRCHTQMGTHEEAVEVGGQPYHNRCNPLKHAPQAALNCRIKLPQQMILPYQA